MTLDTTEATLVSTRDLSPSMAQLILRVEGHTFDYEPGQHVGVAYRDDGLVHRSYSPVSRPGTDTIALAVKRYDDGTCSVWLHEREAGDTVPLTSPSGNLHLRDPERDAVFLSTGTGLTPMMAMLQKYLDEGSGEATFVYGERTEADLAYRDTLDLLDAGHDRLDVSYVLSQPGDDWSGRQGYVQHHLGDLLDPDTDAHVFVCGVPQMVVDTKDTLTADLGLSEEHIFSEGWEEGAAEE